MDRSDLVLLRRTRASSQNVGKISSYQVKLSRKRTFHHFVTNIMLAQIDVPLGFYPFHPPPMSDVCGRIPAVPCSIYFCRDSLCQSWTITRVDPECIEGGGTTQFLTMPTNSIEPHPLIVREQTERVWKLRVGVVF